MKHYTLLIALMLGLAFSASAQALRTHYGEGQKSEPHQLNIRFGDIIYDQSPDDQYGGYIVSQFFTDPASADLSSEAADDFVVPEGETWTVGSFGVWGTWWPESAGDPEKIDITIYEDDGGKPGAVIDGYGEETNFYAEEWFTGDEHESYYNFTFPSPLTFTEGHYWISFQVHDNYDKVGQWGWQDKPNTNWEVWHFRNPGGGFPGGFIDWAPSNLVTTFANYFDLRFALYGEAYDNDIALLSFSSPETGSLTANEIVTVTIKNQGNNTQTGFNIAFQVDGGAWVVENVGSLSLASEESADYTFTATADLSATGFHTINAKTMLAGDEQPANDEAAIEVANYGTIYQMVNNDTIDFINACSGTFTDPGGVDGPMNPGTKGVVTFYPEAGKKIKMEFFGVWDISHPLGGVKPFRVFDGPDINAPLIGEWTQNDWRDYGIKPGILKALGATGAMTIRYACPTYYDGPEGWTALVECYTQQDDDFEMTEFHIDPTLVFTDQDITLSATVRNIGATAQTKTVTFYVNNIAVGTATTEELAPTETGLVEYVHVFTASGDVEIKAALPEDSGDINDNEKTIETFVWLNGWFVEGFDDGYFPPDDWTPGLSWTGNEWGYSGACATSWIPTFTEDTLWTPQLVMHDGDFISFYASTSNWNTGNLKIVWKNGETGETHLLEYIDLAFSSQFINLQVDVSAAAGNNYIGFVNVADIAWSWASEVYIDEVMGAGILYYYYDYDMKMVEFNPFPTPSKNEPVNYQVKVQNNGLVALADGDYTVKIMQITENGDVEMASVPGIAANPTQTKTHTLSVTFDKIGPTEIYAIVDYPDDQKPDNDSSVVRPVFVQVNGTTIVEVADGTTEEYSIPSSFGGSSNISEVIYPAEMINPTDITGFITGMAYEFNNYNTAPTLNLPIEIYIGETEEGDLSNGFINGTELTKVAEATIDLQMGLNQMLYIPYIAPYDYQGGNLCVLFYYPGSNDWPLGVEWLGISHGPTPDSTVAYTTSFNPPLDPNTIGFNPNLNFRPFTPKTSFYIGTVGTADLSGFVYDEASAPFEGVKVEVVGFDNETYSAANGSYAFTSLLAWENLIKATHFGYYDNNQSITLLEEGINTLDFDMEPLPQVMVYGQVIGDWDYTHFLEGAQVSLTGYEDYSTTVAADGTFAIENVYGAKTYTLTITYPGYQTYTDANVQVTDVDYNLYTISLSELMLSPFYTQAEQINPGTVQVTWMSPMDGVASTLTWDYVINNGYTAEAGEEVWLGNIYEMEPGTIEKVSLYWTQYGETSGTVVLDLVDLEGNVFYSSEPFETLHNGWTVVDVPNITFEGGQFYAMAYWDGTNTNFTDYLAADAWESGTGINFGYIMYPGAPPYLVSELLPDLDFTFQIDIDIVNAAPEKGRYNLGYNILRGPYADVNNWSSWEKINNEPVTGNEYLDGDWPQPEEGYTYGVQTVYTTGTSEPSFSLPIVHDPDMPCTNPWTYTITGSLHTINISATADVNIFGEPLVVGDWIGVFYLDANGNEACGGAGRWGGPFAGGSGGALITAYGDDPTTPEKDGFAEDETIRWRMNDCSAWEEYPAVATYNPNKPNMGQFADFGLSSVLVLEVMYCQYYTFAQGWNSLSSYINPIDPDVENMFAPMLNQLTIVRNTTQVYWPEENVNTLVNWDSNSGYVLKATEDVQFEICGNSSVDGELVMENAGWYFMPVLSACAANVEELFGEQISDVIIIQEIIGNNMYWPSQQIYTLQELTPGRAYKIKVAAPMTLQFPMCDGYDLPGTITLQNHTDTPWGTLNMTPATQTVSFDARALAQFAAGDMIGAFNSSNEICGFMQIDNTGKNQSMVLFGDDGTTIAHDGYAENENITFRILGSPSGEESELQVQWDNATDNTSGMFMSESLSKIMTIDQTTTSIGSLGVQASVAIYPNPATDRISISIQTETMDQAEATIIDTKGNVMLQQPLTQRQSEMNISSLSAGIYFVKITSSHFNKVSKLIVK
jgi:hypothetical protein